MKKQQPEPAHKSVGIWIRVSTEDQVKGESPEHHERRARMYAEAKDWNVREVYSLNAVSGKSVMDHPEAKRMLEDIRTGRITGLIFSKLARLARNTRELLDFADYFREHDADLISLQEAIDTSSPAGRLFYTMIAGMAQWEREEIGARVAASVPIRAKMGKSLGGAAPYGYRWESRELVPDPKEAPIRRLMYDLFLEHKRMKLVARLLNEAGHRTRNGSKFSGTTVDRLIRDPTAKGERRANWTRSTGTGKHWERKPEDEWILMAVPAIVPVEIWKAANALLTERQANGKPRPGPKPVHLFTGVVVCHCGQKMRVPSNSPKYICFGCRNKIPVAALEAVFKDQLRGFVMSAEDIAAYLTKADAEVQSKTEALEILDAERGRVMAEMQRVYRAYVADEISVQTYGSQYRPLEERLGQIDDELPRLQGHLDFLKIQLLSQDEALTEARDLYSRWTDLELDDKRQIIDTIVEQVVVGKGDVEIHLSYLPSSSEVVAQRQRIHRGSWRPGA